MTGGRTSSCWKVTVALLVIAAAALGVAVLILD
jgi:hypothetical protein